jgi:hypothetical protein
MTLNLQSSFLTIRNALPGMASKVLRTCRNRSGRLRRTVGQLTTLVGMGFACVAAGGDLDFLPVGNWPGPEVDLGSGVAVVGRYAFVTGGGHRPGLSVFDVGEAAPPRLVASLTTDRPPGMVPEIAVSGNHAFIAEGDGRMLVVDISEPTRPQLLTAFDTAGEADHLAVAGAYVYLAAASFSRDAPDAPPGMVQIIDASDPAHPRQVSSYAMAPISANSFAMRSVASDGQFLCIAYDTGSTAMLEVVDVSDPAAPRRVGVYEAPGGVNGGGVNALAVGNGRAYFAPYSISATFTRLSRVEVVDLADPTGPRRLGSFNTTGEVRSLALAGQYLYAAKDTYPGGPVDIINIADPAKPVRVGGFGDSTQYDPHIAVNEGRACVRTGGALISFDVSQPTVMRRIGTLSTGYATADVAVAGSHAIVADGENGLRVLDVSQPVNPRLIREFNTAGSARQVVVLGNHAYVADREFLLTFDLSQPGNLRRTSMLPADATDLAVSGNALCTVGYGSELQVFDRSNPAVPRRVGLHQVRYSDGQTWVAASSNYVFVASAQSWPPASAVEVFDISIPSSPQLVSSYEPPGRPSGIAVSGNLAVLAGNAYLDPQDFGSRYGYIEVLDVSDPGNPTLLASLTLDGVGDVTILDQRAFVAYGEKDPLGMVDRLGNLVVLDLSEPTRPRRVGGYKSVGGRVALSGGYLFATAGYSGVSILQVRETAVGLSTTLEVGGKAFGVAAEGSIGCAAAGEAGLQVLNLSDPSLPAISSSLPTDGTALDVALTNGRAYVAAGAAGLMIADLSSSANPQRLGVLDTPGDARAVLVSGTTAYVADGTEGVQVVDVTDPRQPRRLGGHGTTGWATGLALYGTNLLVACREAGLLVLDVSDPVNPRSVATYNRGGYVVAVTVVGSRAILSDGLEGITILDLTDPGELKRIGAAPGGGGYGRGIAVSGRFAYVASDRAGVQVYDLADPARPRHRGGNTALEAYRLVISGGRLLAAGGQGGLGVFDLFAPPLNVVASTTQAPGSLNLQVDGPAGTSVRVQRSTDLSNWQDWQTVTLGELPQTLSDAVNPSQPQRFYRAANP